MSLPNYLTKIKSSGIYRFVWDKSEISATDAETLRLVVGYSEKGPFNTPVFIETPSDFRTIFGDVNKKLEKRGIFFHRMALQALAAGPILALNLKKFTDEETVQYATANGTGDLTLSTTGVTVDKIYNTSRFWTLNPDGLVDLDNAVAADAGSGIKPYVIIAAADADSSSNTVFIRPCKSTGYDVTIKSWYSSMGEEMPDYFIGFEDLHVSDFFAEIYVFKGQFTTALAQNEELKRYFTVDGDKVILVHDLQDAFGTSVDVLDALASNENSGFIQKYQGVTLPYFKNSTGAYISLDLLFNADYNSHKMIMKLNSDLLDDGVNGVDETPFTPLDVVTRGWDNLSITDLSCAAKIATGHTTSNQAWGVSTLGDTDIKPYAEVIEYDNTLTSTDQPAEPTISIDGYVVETNISAVDPTTGYEVVDRDSTDLHYTIHSNGTDAHLSIFSFGSSAESMDQVITVSGFEAIVFSQKFTVGQRFLVNVSDDTTQRVGVATLAKIEFTTDPSNDGNKILRLTFDKKCKPLSLNWDSSENLCIVRCNSILNIGTAVSPLYIKGYVKTNTRPTSNTVEGKLAWQKSLLEVISTDSAKGYPGLIEALTNRVDVDYRYIVDTFESYIDAELKSSLSLLAKKKDNCMLLSNFPAIQTFVKSKNTSFTDSNGQFQMKYVKVGANTSKPASTLFSLPSADNGASWCSFNTPLIFSDGTVKTTVPAAALVSNNFMAKYEGRQPYYIVAGPTYGRLSYPGLIGPDYNFSRADLDILEPMGVNATVYVPKKGTFINSNQTAKQNPVTALSKINVRELVIYLQDQIEDLLQNYQWEFNTPALRNLIKAKADTICDNVKANGGIYNFLNVCDESNNDDEVINNEMIVLSTSIEPGLGAGKMVQELTIYKKGGMSAIIK